MSSNINDKKDALLGTLKDLIKRGNTRVIIKSEEKVILDLLIYIGVFGSVLCTCPFSSSRCIYCCIEQI